MNLTKNHKKIIAFIYEQPRTKAEIIEQFKGWYHRGLYASKYLPVTLNALVKHNILECVDGVYKTIIEKQTKLFNDKKNEK